MDADKEVPDKKEKDLMSVGTAMTHYSGFCHYSIINDDEYTLSGF